MEGKTKDGRATWTRTIDLPAIPGCALGGRRACGGLRCAGCGWNKDEIARRRGLLDRNGLTRDKRTGLKHLVVTRPDA